MNSEDIRQIIREEMTTGNPVSSKKKREPTEWNKFLKDCAPTHKDMPFGDRVKACSVEYHEKKGGSKKVEKAERVERTDNIKQEARKDLDQEIEYTE